MTINMPVRELVNGALTRIRRSEFAANTVKLGLGHGLRLVIQAVYFVLIARSLGPKEYGAFVAMTSLVAIAAPFAGFGSPIVLLKNVSRNRDLLPAYWGSGLLTIAISGSLLSLLILAFTPFLLGRQFFLMTVLVCLSDLLMIRVAELSAFAFAALGRMGESARINVYITLTRLIGIVIISALVHHPKVREWTAAYVMGSVVCFIYSFLRVTVTAGRIDIRPRQAWRDLPESALFAISTSSATIYNDLDKTMVGKLATFTAAGIYSAAYRIIDVSLVPVRAMLSAAYPEFFRVGVNGPSATKRYAYKLIRRAVPFGLIVTVGLLIGAPVIPHILGRSYFSAVEALRWLAVIPLLRCIHVFLADGLTGAGYQGRRTAVQVGVGIMNALLNVYFIRHWSWRGAAWTSILCDASLALSLWLMLESLASKQVNVLEAETCPDVVTG
jgi:O-antigen/teichoic acid export membrane protein